MIISKDGVTQDITALPDGTDVCTDIDIEDDVKTLVLGGTGPNPVSYELRRMMKCFPSVETLVIRRNVTDISISNFSFPNVRNVSSFSAYFSSGPYLFKSDGYKKVLLNTFCQEENNDLDFFTGGIVVSDFAMEGCRSRNVRFPEYSFMTEESSFSGTEFTLRPFTDGVSCAGNKIVLIDDQTEEVVFAPEITGIVSRSKKYTLKRVVISTESHTHILGLAVTSADTVVIDGDVNPDWIHFPSNVLNLDLRNSVSYRSIDGILFTNDMTRIVHFPGKRTGSYEIPEGIIGIGESAFSETSLTSVKLPDSLVYIGSSAFYQGKIETVDFGNGVRVISKNAFAFSDIKKADIPPCVSMIDNYAFQYCDGLEEVKLHNGLVQIGNTAFAKCDSLHSITLPETLAYADEGSLLGIDDIYLSSNEIPVSFFRAVFLPAETAEGSTKAFRLHYKGKTLALPQGVSPKTKTALGYIRFADMIFTQETADSVPQMVTGQSDRQDLMISMMEDFSPEKQTEYRSYLRKCGKKIISRLIAEQKEQLLIKFIGLNIATKNTLAGCMDMVPDSMLQVKAALMESVGGDKKRKSFGL